MKDILEKVNRNDGIKVPEGYFDDFARRMEAALPQQPWEQEIASGTPHVVPRSFWQKIRPYVYLAAMFMGVWCMMKTFDMMRPSTTLSFDSNPDLAAAVSNEYFVDNYILSNGDISEYDLLSDLYETGYVPSSYTVSTDDNSGL
ncbi:MAG: hypothetical protein HDR97_00825 [Bacteroides sp.]|nr:hypothetical protein [Bacteroides sp.]MBD5332281.1 hypothetical protein [Bacteroides sp.]